MLEKTKVKDLMTKDVLTVDCEEATVFAFEKLMKHKISAMPVVNEEGKMVGIVTATDFSFFTPFSVRLTSMIPFFSIRFNTESDALLKCLDEQMTPCSLKKPA